VPTGLFESLDGTGNNLAHFRRFGRTLGVDLPDFNPSHGGHVPALLTATLALYAVYNRMVGVERMRLG